MTSSIDRRTFLKQAAVAGAGLSVAGSLGAAHGMAAPHNRVRVALMGVNARGGALARTFAHIEGAEVAYVADVDERAARKITQEVDEIQGQSPERITDFRRALDDDEVDALVIAAPDHWHAPAALMALSAGKHVYVEKPCSHNPREGELLVEAQRKHGLVVQMGNQRRSWSKVKEAIDLIQRGEIGPVHIARCWYSRDRAALPEGQQTKVPGWLDWELWQGPAPRTAFQDNYLHYNWHWFWNWGTGESGNNGVHMLDLARWGLGVDYPTRVTATGGRYAHDRWQHPDGQMLTYEYENGKMATWEGSSFNGLSEHGTATGVLFRGEEGALVIRGGNSYVLYDGDGNEVRDVQGEARREDVERGGAAFARDRSHVDNFLAAIRSGETLNSHIEGGHKSTLMCHLGNIAYRSQALLQCDPNSGRISGNREIMQKYWGREYESGWEPSV